MIFASGHVALIGSKKKDGEDILSPSSEYSACELEDIFQSKLDVAGFVGCVGDLPESTGSGGAGDATEVRTYSAAVGGEVGRAGGVCGWCKTDHVERIEEISTELDMTAFGDGEVLGERQVNLLIGRSTLRANGGGAKAG